MNDLTHLTPAQLDGILIGDTDPATQLHLASCPACAASLANTRSSLTLFGETLTNMAQQHRPRPATLLSTPKRPVFRLAATFALAASVAIVAAFVPFGHMQAPPAIQTALVQPVQPTHTVESDEALLNEIDQQLSTSVPEALAPLEGPKTTTAK